MDLFFIDEKRNIKKTYLDLLKDLNKTTELSIYIYESNPYKIFLKLIQSMIAGVPIEILDYDFSLEEIKNLGINENDLKNKEICETEVNNYNELLDKIKKNSDKWKISLYTSGTTGKPKRVSHTLSSLTRNVKSGDRFKKNVWGFAYNPTHFAGLQVFYQAFFNKNTLIYLFDYSPKKINDIIIERKVTHISATPTFYRNLVPYIYNKIQNVRRITLGGEKFDLNLKSEIKNIFPNAKLRNIYASTEAGSLFSSSGEYFYIKESMKEKIKISEDKELLIHKSLLGESLNYSFQGVWYNTGDIVEKIDKNRIKFISRKSDLINVGGYNVNPHEIEEMILKVNGVIDVTITGRRNKITGNILQADIEKENSISEVELEKRIHSFLKNNLQKWKIPRNYNFVEKIKKTRTGKKVR